MPDIEFNYGNVYVRFNVQRIVVPDPTPEDEEHTREEWQYDEWFMTSPEYQLVQQGIMPYNGQWDAALHKVFREYQHKRADDQYVYATRMFRATSDSKYSDYIAALDQWNAQVSALADTMSLNVPALPTLD